MNTGDMKELEEILRLETLRGDWDKEMLKEGWGIVYETQEYTINSCGNLIVFN